MLSSLLSVQYRGDFPFSPLILWNEQKVKRYAHLSHYRVIVAIRPGDLPEAFPIFLLPISPVQSDRLVWQHRRRIRRCFIYSFSIFVKRVFRTSFDFIFTNHNKNVRQLVYQHSHDFIKLAPASSFNALDVEFRDFRRYFFLPLRRQYRSDLGRKFILSRKDVLTTSWPAKRQTLIKRSR